MGRFRCIVRGVVYMRFSDHYRDINIGYYFLCIRKGVKYYSTARGTFDVYTQSNTLYKFMDSYIYKRLEQYDV